MRSYLNEIIESPTSRPPRPPRRSRSKCCRHLLPVCCKQPSTIAHGLSKPWIFPFRQRCEGHQEKPTIQSSVSSCGNPRPDSLPRLCETINVFAAEGQAVARPGAGRQSNLIVSPAVPLGPSRRPDHRSARPTLRPGWRILRRAGLGWAGLGWAGTGDQRPESCAARS